MWNSGNRRPVDVDVGTAVVTGSTGNVGGRVARSLAEAGVPLRLPVRDASRAPRLDGAEVVEFVGYGDGAQVREVLRGADVVLMVSGAESEDRLQQHMTFVDAAAEAGVRHVVYTSFYGASPTCTFLLGRDHAATEARILANGLEATFLRDNLYADVLPHLAGVDGVLRGPAGTGRLSAVAVDDVAAVATAVLLEPGVHAGTAYELTGPEALTLAEVADVMSEVTGRPYRYEPETMEQAYASRRGLGAASWLVDAWVSTYTAIAAGEMDGVSDHVGNVLGRPATGLAEVLRRAP